MKIVSCAIFLASAAALLCTACATSPLDEERRRAQEADIAEVLSTPLDPAEFGETKRCLSDREYRGFRVLDSRRILFEGRQGRLWLNTLRSPCHDLRHGSALVVRQFSATRMCDKDRFNATDWFSWPWYRRSPGSWWQDWGSGVSCSLGEFQPVTAEQVAEIEAILEAR